MRNVQDYVDEMLSEPQRVLVYAPEDEDLAHEVMEAVVLQLASEISISNPDLENLVVLDSETQIWEEDTPGIQVADLGDVKAGRFHLSRSMCIAVFGNKFLRTKILSPYVSSTRFYAAVAATARFKFQVERVHPLRKAVFLT